MLCASGRGRFVPGRHAGKDTERTRGRAAFEFFTFAESGGGGSARSVAATPGERSEEQPGPCAGAKRINCQGSNAFKALTPLRRALHGRKVCHLRCSQQR